jgi:O-antigen ligase
MLTALIRFVLFMVGSTLLLDQLEAYSLSGFLISPNKALTAVLLLLVIFQCLMTGVRVPRNAKNGWIVAFYLSLLLSTIYAISQGSDGGLLLIRWTTFLSMLAFYFLMCLAIRSQRDLDLFLWSLIVSGFIAAISAYFSKGQGGYWNPVRKSGIGSGQNQAAGNLLAIIPLTYVLAGSARSLVTKSALFGIAMVLVLGFGLALSRSAFLAAIAMGILFVIRLGRMPDPRLIVAALILLIVAVATSPEGYGERLHSLLLLSSGKVTSAYAADTFSGRLEIYKAAITGFATHPVFGVGAERYLEWVPSYDPRLAGGFNIHNAILYVACQQGLLGLIPYISILFLTYVDFSQSQRLARARRLTRDAQLSAFGMRSAMLQIGYIGILVVAQFQPGTFWRVLWVMFALSTITLSLTRARVAEMDASKGSSDSVAPGAQDDVLYSHWGSGTTSDESVSG